MAARQAETEYSGPRELYWLAWFESEWDNLRAAVEWSIEARPQEGLELVNCLGHFIVDNWHVSDMENWLTQLIPHPSNAARTRIRALVLSYWAQSIVIGTNRLDVPSTDSLIEEALSIFEGLGDKRDIAFCIVLKGHFYGWRCEPHKGCPLLEQALLIFREMDDKLGIAISLRKESV